MNAYLEKLAGSLKLGFGEIEVVGKVANEVVDYIESRLGKPFGFTINRSETHSDISFVIARRFNVGNVAHDGRIMMQIPSDVIDHRMVDEFIEKFMDVTSPERGDAVISPFIDFCKLGAGRYQSLPTRVQDELDDEFSCQLCEASCLPEPGEAPRKGLLNRLLGFTRERDNEPAELDEREADAVIERQKIDRKRTAELEEIKRAVIRYVTTYHADPTMLINELVKGKIVMNPNGLSRLTINGETRVFLPDYDEAEVRMTAMERSLYILFLLHPDGLRQSEVCDHKQELVSIYSIVKPGASEKNIKRYVENVCNVGSDALRQNLSRIKKAFKELLPNDDLARNYYINGERNGIYKIELPRDKVLIPAIFKA